MQHATIVICMAALVIVVHATESPSDDVAIMSGTPPRLQVRSRLGESPQRGDSSMHSEAHAKHKEYVLSLREKIKSTIVSGKSMHEHNSHFVKELEEKAQGARDRVLRATENEATAAAAVTESKAELDTASEAEHTTSQIVNSGDSAASKEKKLDILRKTNEAEEKAAEAKADAEAREKTRVIADAEANAAKAEKTAATEEEIAADAQEAKINAESEIEVQKRDVEQKERQLDAMPESAEKDALEKRVAEEKDQIADEAEEAAKEDASTEKQAIREQDVRIAQMPPGPEKDRLEKEVATETKQAQEKEKEQIQEEKKEEKDDSPEAHDAAMQADIDSHKSAKETQGNVADRPVKGLFGDGRYKEALRRVVNHYCSPEKEFCNTAKKLQASYDSALKSGELAKYFQEISNELKSQCDNPEMRAKDRCKSLKILNDAKSSPDAKTDVSTSEEQQEKDEDASVTEDAKSDETQKNDEKDPEEDEAENDKEANDDQVDDENGEEQQQAAKDAIDKASTVSKEAVTNEEKDVEAEKEEIQALPDGTQKQQKEKAIEQKEVSIQEKKENLYDLSKYTTQIGKTLERLSIAAKKLQVKPYQISVQEEFAAAEKVLGKQRFCLRELRRGPVSETKSSQVLEDETFVEFIQEDQEVNTFQDDEPVNQEAEAAKIDASGGVAADSKAVEAATKMASSAVASAEADAADPGKKLAKKMEAQDAFDQGKSEDTAEKIKPVKLEGVPQNEEVAKQAEQVSKAAHETVEDVQKSEDGSNNAVADKTQEKVSQWNQENPGLTQASNDTLAVEKTEEELKNEEQEVNQAAEEAGKEANSTDAAEAAKTEADVKAQASDNEAAIESAAAEAGAASEELAKTEKAESEKAESEKAENENSSNATESAGPAEMNNTAAGSDDSNTTSMRNDADGLPASYKGIMTKQDKAKQQADNDPENEEHPESNAEGQEKAKLDEEKVKQAEADAKAEADARNDTATKAAEMAINGANSTDEFDDDSNSSDTLSARNLNLPDKPPEQVDEKELSKARARESANVRVAAVMRTKAREMLERAGLPVPKRLQAGQLDSQIEKGQAQGKNLGKKEKTDSLAKTRSQLDKEARQQLDQAAKATDAVVAAAKAHLTRPGKTHASAATIASVEKALRASHEVAIAKVALPQADSEERMDDTAAEDVPTDSSNSTSVNDESNSTSVDDESNSTSMNETVSANDNSTVKAQKLRAMARAELILQGKKIPESLQKGGLKKAIEQGKFMMTENTKALVDKAYELQAHALRVTNEGTRNETAVQEAQEAREIARNALEEEGVRGGPDFEKLKKGNFSAELNKPKAGNVTENGPESMARVFEDPDPNRLSSNSSRNGNAVDTQPFNKTAFADFANAAKDEVLQEMEVEGYKAEGKPVPAQLEAELRYTQAKAPEMEKKGNEAFEDGSQNEDTSLETNETLSANTTKDNADAVGNMDNSTSNSTSSGGEEHRNNDEPDEPDEAPAGASPAVKEKVKELDTAEDKIRKEESEVDVQNGADAKTAEKKIEGDIDKAEVLQHDAKKSCAKDKVCRAGLEMLKRASTHKQKMAQEVQILTSLEEAYAKGSKEMSSSKVGPEMKKAMSSLDACLKAV